MAEAGGEAGGGGSGAQEAVVKGGAVVPVQGESGATTSTSGDENVKMVGILELFRFADWKDWCLMVGGAIGGSGMGAVLPLFSIVLGSLVDDFQNATTDDEVRDAGDRYALLFTWLSLGAFACGFAQVAFFTITSERQTLRIRKEYLDSILKQEIGWFDTTQPGELSSKIAEHTIIIREGMGEKLGALFQFGNTFLVGYIVGFVKNWRLTLVVLSVAPLLAAGGFMMILLMDDATSDGLGAYGRAGGIAEEAFSMIRAIQSYSIEGRVARRYRQALLTAETAGIKKARAQGLGMGFTFGVYFLSYALAFWYGAVLVQDSQDAAVAPGAFPPSPNTTDSRCHVGQVVNVSTALEMQCVNNAYDETYTFLTDADVCNCVACNCGCFASDDCVNGGDILLVFFSVILASFGLGQAAPSISALNNARTAAAKIFAIIARVPEIDVSDPGGKKPASAAGHLVFSNVHFAYPSRREVTVFNGLDLDIKAGETVALVGGSGCGKSTVTQLAMRFYDVEAGGSVRLDGDDIKDLNVKWLRQNIGLVGQEPVLFATSIRENISHGAPEGHEPTLAEIEDAARAANCYDFVSALPDGFDTFVGERGSTLSGGQKQRLAIARAIIRDPKILILDEATSALDNESERIVQEALDKLLQQKRRTTIVIAHRLSTVRSANRIVVLGPYGAGVLEQGSHEELLAADGHYAALVAAAQRSQEGGGDGEVDIKQLMEQDEDMSKRFGSNLSSTSSHASGTLTSPKSRPSSSSSSVSAGAAAAAAAASPAGAAAASPASAAVAAAAGPESAATISPVGPVLAGSNANLGDVEVKTASSAKFKKRLQKEGDDDTDSKASEAKEEMYSVPVSRIFEFSQPERWYFVPALAAAALNGSIMPLFAILFSNLSLVYFFPTQELVREQANQFSLYFVALSFVTAIAYYGQFTYFGFIGEKMTTRVRYRLFKALLHQETAFYDEKKNSVGALSGRLATDAAVVKAAVTDRMGLTVMNLVTLSVGLVIAFVYGWELALALLALLPLIVVSAMAQMLVMAGLAKADDKALADASQVLSESIGGIRTVTAFDLRPKVVALYDGFLVGPQKLGVKKGLSGGAGFGFAQLVLFIVYAVAFFYGSRLIVNNGYSFQDVMNVFFAIVMMGFGMGQSAAMAPDVAKASVGVSNVFRIVDRKSKIDASSLEGVNEEAATDKDIVFRNVEFTYATRPDAKIFDGMSLTVKGGATVGLVGESGSGKSTTISLLERFYDVSGGSVSFHGIDTRQANVHWLRSQIGLVQQEPQLFDTTIFENIAFGMPEKLEDQDQEASSSALVTQEMVEEAAKKANAHNFICGFPDGYQTQVGGKGSQLSGGQKQRICLARCLIRNPKVLLLDEATSALDNESERVVQQALDKLVAENDCTTIAIAHRLSSIQHSDVIYVFDHGAVVEQGTHDELLALEGVYSKLYFAQERQHSNSSGTDSDKAKVEKKKE